jgi:hypothetical protein
VITKILTARAKSRKTRRNIDLCLPKGALERHSFGVLCVLFVVMIVWYAVDPPRMQFGFASVTDVYLNCESYTSPFNYALALIEACAIVVACAMALPVRDITSMFNEWAITLRLLGLLTVFWAVPVVLAGVTSAGDGVNKIPFILALAFSQLLWSVLTVAAMLWGKVAIVRLASWVARHNSLELFVSYSEDDLGFVDKLVQAMGNSGLGVFVDTQRSEAGAYWRREVGQAIRVCKALVFVVSESSVQTPYCLEEVQFAVRFDAHAHRRKDAHTQTDRQTDTHTHTHTHTVLAVHAVYKSCVV